MGARRFALLTGSVLLTIALGSASSARATLRADEVLASQEVKDLERVGIIVVGREGREANAARVLARTAFEAAGRRVAQLPASVIDPPRALLLNYCVSRDLDAVALVRISTASAGWRVDVDIRDAAGKPVVAKMVHTTSPFGGEGESIPVYAEFALAMSESEVAALEQESDGLEEQQADAAPTGRPRLWVSEKATMLGVARVNGAEFYRIVGRPDLAASYRHNSAMIGVTRGFGYTALGLGTTTLVLAAAAAGFEEGFCFAPNLADQLASREHSCGGSAGALLVVPLLLSGTGVALLAASYGMSRDPISLREKRALAREYNAREPSAGAGSPRAARVARRPKLAVSGAPFANSDGGMLLLGGRF